MFNRIFFESNLSQHSLLLRSLRASMSVSLELNWIESCQPLIRCTYLFTKIDHCSQLLSHGLHPAPCRSLTASFTTATTVSLRQASFGCVCVLTAILFCPLVSGNSRTRLFQSSIFVFIVGDLTGVLRLCRLFRYSVLIHSFSHRVCVCVCLVWRTHQQTHILYIALVSSDSEHALLCTTQLDRASWLMDAVTSVIFDWSTRHNWHTFCITRCLRCRSTVSCAPWIFLP